MDILNLFKVGTRKKEEKALQAQVATLQQAVQRSFINTASRNFFNQNIAHFPEWNLENQVARYSTTDDIYSIVRLIATTAAMIPLYAYEVVDEKLLKRMNYTSFDTKALLQTKMLQLKALEDLPETDRLYELLEDPHIYLSKFEFLEAIHTLLLTQGECILYKLRAEVGPNTGLPIKLEFLESTNVVRYVSNFPHRIYKYEYRENGVAIIENIPPEDVIHIRHYKGLSPLQALSKRLIRMDEALDRSVAQMQNGGVPTIIYNEGDAEADGKEVIDEQKINFYNFLSNRANTGAPFWAGYEKLGKIELGLKLADMNVAELEKIDFKKLCNAFGVSDMLFNNDTLGAESNVIQQEKRLYTNTCLPSVHRVKDALKAGLVDEFAVIDRKKRTIEFDISDISVLHEDLAKKIAQFSNMPVMIPNQIFEAMGFPKMDNDPAMDKVYVKTGYTLLEDLQSSGDLPLTADYIKP